MVDGVKRGRGVGCAVAAMALVAVTLPGSSVMADDAGGHAFFMEQAGYGRPEPASQQALIDPSDRPLVVKRKRQTASHRPVIQVAVGPQAPVTIYDDQTLRPGDAVMTAKGLRVFVGDRGTTHSETDFVALSDAEGLPKQVQKELLVIDKAPHG